MKKNEMMEKMPKFMQQAMGQAQKHMTLWEGEARKAIMGTYSKLMANPSMKKMGASAAATIGLATQTDIRSIRNKVEKLRDEIRKFTRRPAGKPSAQPSART